MKHRLILLTLILLSQAAFASPIQHALPVLGDGAYASIITCGPGNEFYCACGHSALRIRDTSQRIDVVFNYGSFDYTEKFFYLKFIKGKLDYFLWPYYYDEFIYEYIFEGRAVWEQQLCLDSAELNRLFLALMENAQPENMYYKYDFFRDNCATRVRDMIDTIIGAESHYGYTPYNEKHTYRNMLYKYTGKTMQWWQFGVDLILGMRCDQNVDIKQHMYLPMEMMYQYDTIHRKDGRPLVLPARQLLRDSRTPLHRSFSPTLCFWIVFAATAALSFIGRKKGWKLYWLDGILYGICTVVSLLICYLWFVSDHWCTKANLNLIWANPIVIWLLVRLKKPAKLPALIMIVTLLLFLAGWAWWPQQLNLAVIPIVLTLLVRLLDKVRGNG